MTLIGFECFFDFRHGSVYHIRDMRSSLGRAIPIHKRHSFGRGPLEEYQVPSWCKFALKNFFFRVKSRVIDYILAFQTNAIEMDLDCGSRAHNTVVNAFGNDSQSVVTDRFHPKGMQVWNVRYFGKLFPREFPDLGFALDRHVLGPFLRVLLRSVTCLDSKLYRKHVCQLDTEPVLATSCSSASIVIVASAEQMSKHEFWDVYLVLGVNLDRDPSAVIQHGNLVCFLVDNYSDFRHSVVLDTVVNSIVQYFFENVLERRCSSNYLFTNFRRFAVSDPRFFNDARSRSNVHAWSVKNMFALVEFLVRLFQGFWWHCR
jgi:hypothetical protein